MTERDHRADFYDNDYEGGEGVWRLSDDYESKQRELVKRYNELHEVARLVKAGTACFFPCYGWHTQNPDTIIDTSK